MYTTIEEFSELNVYHISADGIDDVEKLAVKGTGKETIIRVSVPIKDIQGYWTPNLIHPNMTLKWVIEFDSVIQKNFPFITFFNQNGCNRHAVWLTDAVTDIKVKAMMNQEKSCYDLSFAMAAHEDDFTLVIDGRDIAWTETVTECRNAIAGDIPEFPAQAWEPVFCTWYAAHAALTQEWSEKTAELAAGLGFKTFILDDGWCFDTVKRVSPATIETWYEEIGDWQVSTSKYPDFKQHVANVQKLGMAYMVWVAPFLLGTETETYKACPEQCFQVGRPDGCMVIDPANVEATDVVIDKMTALMKDYKLDGLKIDFIDTILCSAEKPTGSAVKCFLDKLTDGIRRIKADALIEYRQQYSTPSTLRYATQFRAGDVPYDFLENFYRVAQIRVMLGDKVPVHADPVYWHPAETPENISRHMICALAGVPMMSMDLEKIGEQEQRIIRFWLDFYQQHLALFKSGHWQVEYNHTQIAYISVEADTETAIFILDQNRVPTDLIKRGGIVYILNISGSELEIPEVQELFSASAASGKAAVAPGGLGVIK